MSDILLQVSDLTTRLGNGERPVRVVDGIDLEIRRGETFALLGESGCGKSMTALTLMRLLPPSGRITAGSVRLDGTELLALPEAQMRRVRGGRMGMIFQEPQSSLNPVLTVGQQIAEALRVHKDTLSPGGGSGRGKAVAQWQESLPPRGGGPGQGGSVAQSQESLPPRGGGPGWGGSVAQSQGSLPPRGGGSGWGGSVAQRLNPRRITERVLELLNAVGIPDPARRIDEYPHQLSGGMKQRVMIAMALAGNPELLIADEPTTALDVTIQAQVLRLLKGLQRETGMAVLLITHDLGVVAETADRLAVMYAGQIVETATVAEFFACPAHPYSRKLMDSLPTPEKRAGSLAVIPGRVPPLDQPFQGCRFADRCDRVMEKCQEQEPQWYHPASRHRVRCHLWAEGRPEMAQAGAEANLGSAAPAAGSGHAVLTVDGLKVHFPIQKGVFRRTVGHVKAVDGVDIALNAGRTLALVGESGCGKTTVGKGILQLLAPTGGSVRYDGTELAGLSNRAMRRYRKDLQIIFQDPFASMNPRMLVGDIVGEGLQALGIEPGRAARRTRVAGLLEQVGMSPDAADRYPHEFSGGQRQRICIARALAVEPRVIICDEPTSALDVSVQAQILNLLKQLQDEIGLSYLFITHNISVVSYLAHEVAVMYLGRIVERGTVDEVLGDPRHPYTRALLSAVPVVDKDKRREIIRLEGDMPSPANPPSGCHFHPRCPEAIPECANAYPAATRLSGTRSVHCIRVSN